MQTKVSNAGRAPVFGVARTKVISFPQVSHGGPPTSSWFSDMAALPSGAHCSASPKFHPLIVKPLNFGWNAKGRGRLVGHITFHQRIRHRGRVVYERSESNFDAHVRSPARLLGQVGRPYHGEHERGVWRLGKRPASDRIE